MKPRVEWLVNGRLRPVQVRWGPSLAVGEGFLLGYDWRPIHAYEAIIKLSPQEIPQRVEELVQSDVNFVIEDWSQGFSLKDEEIQHKLVKDFIHECKKKGIHMTAYVTLTRIMWESMFRDEPESKDWIQIDKDGNPVPYPAGRYELFAKPPSYMACVNNPGQRKRLKQIIDLAIDAGAEGIYFDNVFTSCHCPICREKFRKYAKEHLGREMELPSGEAEPTTKASATGLETVNVFSADVLRMIVNDFSNRVLAEVMADMRDHLDSRDRRLILFSNSHERPYIDDACDIIDTEDGVEPGVSENKIYLNVALWRYMYAVGGRGEKPVEGYVSARQGKSKTPKGRKLLEAETASFGVRSLDAGISPAVPFYNKFLKIHEEHYVDVYPVANIVVVVDDIVGKSSFVNSLAENNLMFEVIPLYQAPQKSLDGYRIAILPDVRYMSQGLADAVKGFVKGGGHIISTNQTSLYNERFERRDDYELWDVFATSYSGEGKEKVTNTYGTGTSIFYPYPLEKQMEASEELKKEFMGNVVNLERVPPIELEAQRYVIANIMASKDFNKKVIHLLNYSDEKARDIKIRVNAKGLERAKVNLLTPDDIDRTFRVVEQNEKGLEIEVAELETYSILTII